MKTTHTTTKHAIMGVNLQGKKREAVQPVIEGHLDFRPKERKTWRRDLYIKTDLRASEMAQWAKMIAVQA